MVAIEAFFAMETVLLCIHGKGFKVDVEPVEGFSLYATVLHAVVNLAIVGTGKVDVKEPS